MLDDPQNPAHHRALADALLTNDETERAREEYELALEGFTQGGAWTEGLDAVDALIWLDPRHFATRAEAGRACVPEAVTGSDCSMPISIWATRWPARAPWTRPSPCTGGSWSTSRRTGRRSPPSPRSRPPAARAGVGGAPGHAARRRTRIGAEGRRAAGGRTGAARAASRGRGRGLRRPGLHDFRQRPASRLPHARPGERPTGDEQRDFEETLAQFKRGIEDNIDTDDYQAHYDLGVAFREMGLLD